MPVMVLYKEKSIDPKVMAEMAEKIAKLTKQLLDGAIEVRVIEPIYTFNANPIHLEMRFRDFKEWSDTQLEAYHSAVLELMGDVLRKYSVSCSYSFYILPSQPPRSMWAQKKPERS